MLVAPLLDTPGLLDPPATAEAPVLLALGGQPDIGVPEQAPATPVAGAQAGSVKKGAGAGGTAAKSTGPAQDRQAGISECAWAACEYPFPFTSLPYFTPSGCSLVSAIPDLGKR